MTPAPMVRRASLAGVFPIFTAALLVGSVASRAAAQVTTDTTAAPTTCSGQVISAIDIRPGRPPFSGVAAWWRAAASSIGLHHTTTRADVVAAFLSFDVGDPCDITDLVESERILRAQPFLEAAAILVEADTAGTVRLVVETVDESSLIAAASIRRGTLASLSLGNENIRGRGLMVQVNAERGFAYRNGFGIRATEFATLGQPYWTTLALQRDPLGGSYEVGLRHPFYTDVQRTSWRASVRALDTYYGIRRPADDGLALNVRRLDWQLSGLGRVDLLGKLGIGGLAAMGTQIRPSATGVLVTDSGLVRDSGHVLRGRYRGFDAVRLGAIIGLRSLDDQLVQGFDALTGVQDVATGIQVGALVARGIGAFGASDWYGATELYAGSGNGDSFTALQIDAEMRREDRTGAWSDIVVSGRGAWYKRHGRQTRIISDEFAVGSRSTLPFQLSLGDGQGGVRGYGSSLLVGAKRNVVRIEDRFIIGRTMRRLDLGVAGFADIGSMWAGDAPYGRTIAFRPSLGVSLLGAYPAGSRRVYRVDVAYPLGADADGTSRRSTLRRFEVRFVADTHALAFWREPGDVTRSRTGDAPPQIFNWPQR